jgi:hypothetical protein
MVQRFVTGETLPCFIDCNISLKVVGCQMPLTPSAQMKTACPFIYVGRHVLRMAAKTCTSVFKLRCSIWLFLSISRPKQLSEYHRNKEGRGGRTKKQRQDKKRKGNHFIFIFLNICHVEKRFKQKSSVSNL